VYALLFRDGQVTVALRGRRTSRCWFDVIFVAEHGVSDAVMCLCLHGGQTVVRRLRQSETHDAALNPFIERGMYGATTGHSQSSTTSLSASPTPSVLANDVVIAGPKEHTEGQLRPDFLSAMHRVLGLTDDALCALRSLEPPAWTPYVRNTLCGVRLSHMSRLFDISDPVSCALKDK
jgi:hypothetical protein